MRKLMALVLVVGCSGGSHKEPTFSGVQIIDQTALEDHIYYIDLSVADTPLTTEEVNDPGGAIPIRLIAADDFVVAVGLNPDLGASPADRVMGIWRLTRDLLPTAEQRAEGTDATPSAEAGPRTPSGDFPQATIDAGSAVMLVEWDHEVVDIDPEELDVLVDLSPGRI